MTVKEKAINIAIGTYLSEWEGDAVDFFIVAGVPEFGRNLVRVAPVKRRLVGSREEMGGVRSQSE